MPSLLHTEAIARAAAISVDAYAVDLDLTRGERLFRSTSTIRFTGTPDQPPTFLDLIADTLISFTLDGVALDVAVEDGRIALDAGAGDHELVVVADIAYTNTGQGLHRFVDPVDGNVYVYGTLSPDAAALAYACFDQPDLKASFTVSVTADPSWVAVANSPGKQAAAGRWEFEPTPPISTYVTTVVAGPYHRIDAVHDGIPLGLYCRASLAMHLDQQAGEILAITAACFDRYHELFGVRYPFGKYDQAFVPELVWGAMENPGCVTFRDEFIFTSAVTDTEREERAVVIAHEMAHMWFGDLVTMRWWDDTWLNESFADYLGHRVAAEVTEFTDAWTRFSIGRKAWGYAADQRPSTHPVAPELVADAAQALMNFDGISYAKGCSALRQLVAWLGDDAFFAGLRVHIRAHAYGNATLADLLGALSVASGRDLGEWSRVWLRTEGVSTLRPEVSVDPGGRYESVDIVQTSSGGGPALRPHRIRIAADGFRVDVDIAGARTRVVALTGRPLADLLLPNDGDLTYAKIRLAATDLAGILPTIDDSLTRAVIWGSVWDATRDAETSAAAFLDLCVAVLPAEEHVGILAAVLGYARDFAVDRYLPEADRIPARARLADACRAAIGAAAPGSGRQLAAARGLIACAGDGDADWLRSWLDDASTTPAGLVVDSQLRWALTARLASYGLVGATDIDAELAREHTATAALEAARCRAALPDPMLKEEVWTRLIEDGTASNKVLFALAGGFWQPNQSELLAPYVQRYATDMPAMARRRTAQLTERIVEMAYPRYAVTVSTLDLLTELAEEDLTPAMRKSLVDANDEMARSLAARTW